MGSRIFWRLAVTAVAMTLTAGCGGKASPSLEASGAPASTPTASPAPSTTGFPTSSTPAIDPNIPAAARAHTPAGAEAFARYYVEQINAVGLKPRKGALTQLASTNCKSCTNYETTASYMAAHQQHYSGPIFRIIESYAGAPGEGGVSRTAIKVQQLAIKVLNADGTTAQLVAANTSVLEFDVRWTDAGWRVAKIYVTVAKA